MHSIQRFSLVSITALVGMILNPAELSFADPFASLGSSRAEAASKSPESSGEPAAETSSSDTTAIDRLTAPIDLATEYEKLKAEQEKTGGGAHGAPAEDSEATKDKEQPTPAANDSEAKQVDPAPSHGATPKEEGAQPSAHSTTDAAYTERPKEYSPSIDSSERAILEALSTRRQQLDQREQDMTVRQKLLDAAEQRLDGRLKQLQSISSQLGETDGGAAEATSPAAAPNAKAPDPALSETTPLRDRPRPANTPEMTALIAMYESMSPKAAAPIFEKLDKATVLVLAGGMTPRKLSAIVAAMDPEKASGITDAMFGSQQQQKRMVVQVEQVN